MEDSLGNQIPKIEIILDDGKKMTFESRTQYPISAPLKEWIKKYLTNYFNKPSQSVETLFGKYPAQFDDELRKHLLERQGHKSQDTFFNLLAPIWLNYDWTYMSQEAEKFWERMWNNVHEAETSNKVRIHKGSIFYYWANTALRKGDIDRGFFLIHQAFEEDKETHKSSCPDTPSFKTATMNYEDDHQFLFGYVNELKDYLGKKILIYNHIFSRNFSLINFYYKFQSRPPDVDLIFSFAHTLARMMHIDQYPWFYTENDFAGLYYMNLLFNIILVIDSAIHSKMKNPDDWQYFKLANHLLIESQINVNEPQNQKHLTVINKEKDIEKLINQLLGTTFSFKDKHKPSKLECEVYLSYKLRNFSAHNIRIVPSLWRRYPEIQQVIFNVLFLVVETLY